MCRLVLVHSLGKMDIRNWQPTPHQPGPKLPGKENSRLPAEGCFGSRILAVLSAGEPRNIPALYSHSREHWTHGIYQLPACCPAEGLVSGFQLLEMRLVKQGMAGLKLIPLCGLLIALAGLPCLQASCWPSVVCSESFPSLSIWCL